MTTHSARFPLVCTSLVAAAIALDTCTARADATADKPMTHASVTLRRTTCFGNCPGYTVTLAASGQVSFVGQAHVQTRQAEGRATPAQAAAIMAAVKRSGMHAMQDSYTSRNDGCEMMMSDQPGVKITVTDTAGSKTVDFYNGCEGAVADAVKPKLEQLAKTIDEQLSTARWIGKAAAPGPMEPVDR
jgi:hypothetical protein